MKLQRIFKIGIVFILCLVFFAIYSFSNHSSQVYAQEQPSENLPVQEGQSTDILSAEKSISKIEDCKDVSYEEDELIFEDCEQSKYFVTCDELNQTRYNNTINYNTTCEVVKKVSKIKQTCEQKGIFVKQKFKLDFDSDYTCLPSEDSEKVTILCDSKLDGNGDGKCQAGETCIKFEVQGNNLKKYYRNSRPDFVENDPTFRQKEINMVEIK